MRIIYTYTGPLFICPHQLFLHFMHLYSPRYDMMIESSSGSLSSREAIRHILEQQKPLEAKAYNIYIKEDKMFSSLLLLVGQKLCYNIGRHITIYNNINPYSSHQTAHKYTSVTVGYIEVVGIMRNRQVAIIYIHAG